MAKDNREVLSAVRIGNDVFTAGQEDEIAAALTPENGARLVEADALRGDWEFTGKPSPALPRDPRGRLLRGNAAAIASLQSAPAPAPAPAAPATGRNRG